MSPQQQLLSPVPLENPLQSECNHLKAAAPHITEALRFFSNGKGSDSELYAIIEPIVQWLGTVNNAEQEVERILDTLDLRTTRILLSALCDEEVQFKTVLSEGRVLRARHPEANEYANFVVSNLALRVACFIYECDVRLVYAAMLYLTRCHGEAGRTLAQEVAAHKNALLLGDVLP